MNRMSSDYNANEQRLTWEEILSLGHRSPFLLNCSLYDADAFSYTKPKERGVVIRYLRGHRSGTAAEVFHEWAAALQFPYYFGNNWDAFEECVNDLAWLKPKTRILFLTEIEKIMPRDDRGFTILMDILKLALRGPTEEVIARVPDLRNHPTLIVVLHCDPEFHDECLARLRHVGVEPSVRVWSRPSSSS